MEIKDYVDRALENKNASSVRRNQRNASNYTSGNTAGLESGFAPTFKSRFSFNPDLDTSEGLYSLASKTGLKDKADKILLDNSGEDLNKIFSGGFVSDVFDVLNMTSYGMTGLLKGKGFMEGVKNRESFSDKDALGKFGLGGVIGGIAMDIVVDPMTYIAPYTVLKKIPGVIEIANAAKGKLIGERVLKSIGDTDKIYETYEGGIANGKVREMVQKVAYMFGADPVFKELHEEMLGKIGAETTRAVDMSRALSKLDPKTLKTFLVRDETGRFKRRPLEELQRELSTEDFHKVKTTWDTIDDLGRQMVDVGLLGKDKYEENLGAYIRSVYKEYELVEKGANKGIKGVGTTGIKGVKSRKEGLTKEGMEELGQIEDPAYITGITMVRMISDIENAKFMKKISQNFASDVKFDGAVQIPDTRKFQPTQGWNAEAMRSVKDIDKAMKPLLRELKSTFKADDAVLKEIRDLETDLKTLSSKRSDELYKFFNEGDEVEVTTKTTRRLGVMPDRLIPLASKVAKFDNYEEMLASRTGLELQKVWDDGILERNGFGGGEKALEDFFKQAKSPYKPASESVSEKVLVGNIKKIVELQKKIEHATDKLGKVKDIDKRSINDSFINLEKSINELRLDKDDLLEQINANKMSDLAGKWVPKEMADYVQEIIEPGTPLGATLIANFKYMKVVFNPSTHIRNILSNRTLNWWKLGIGPWRVDLDIKANKVRSVLSKMRKLESTEGMDPKSIEIAQRWSELGGGASTFAEQELKGLLDQQNKTLITGKMGGLWNRVKEKIGDIYQGEEEYAKISAFIAKMEDGLAPEEAFKAAMVATFNYAQVTPFVKKMRTAVWGMPFITFPLKATPIAVETMLGVGTGLGSGAKGLEGVLSKSTRVSVFGKIKNSLLQAADIEETQAELESEPAWVKDGFFVKLPYKDEDGHSMYFDLTYIIPFGDIVSGSLFSRQLVKETGTKEAAIISAASNNPAFQVMKELVRNETFTGEKIFKESDDSFTVSADILRHLLRTFAPPWVASQVPHGFDPQTMERRGFSEVGLMGAMAQDPGSTKRSPLLETLGTFLGMKVQPMSAEINNYYQERNKVNGLSTLLRENGITKDFHRNYIPKTD